MKYLELLEQVELFEAAKDKYLPMFAFFDQMPTSYEYTRIQANILHELEWAIATLKKSERIVWFSRYLRLYAFSMLIPQFKIDMQELQIAIANLTSTIESSRDEDFQSELEPGEEGTLEKVVGGWNKTLTNKREILTSMEKALAKVEKLRLADAKKMSVNMEKEMRAELNRLEANLDKARKELQKVSDSCRSNPEQPQCGRTLEELTEKHDFADNLARIMHDWIVTPAYIEQNSRDHRGMREEIYNIKRHLDHFVTIPYEPIHEYQFGWKAGMVVVQTLKALEEVWVNKTSRIVHHDEDYGDIEKLMDFGDGLVWWNLKRPYCEREGAAMGHCGNNYANNRDWDELVSLRSYEGTEDGKEQWKPHLTFVFDTQKGKFSEMKGFKNQKPDQKYHRYIIPLMQQDWVKGIYIRAGQHERENNFFISDLPEETARAMAAQKPGLVTAVDRKKLGVEGDEEEEEDYSKLDWDQINEILQGWGVEGIEDVTEHDEFILTDLGDTDDAYEILSGSSMPTKQHVDYPDPETRDSISDHFSDALQNEIINYVVENYEDDVVEATDPAMGRPENWEEDEDFDEDEFKESLEEALEFHQAIEILDEYSPSFVESAIDEAYREYHASNMRSYAESEISDYAAEKIEDPATLEYDRGTWEIRVPRDEFYPLMDKIRDAAEGYRGGEMPWAVFFDATIGPIEETYELGAQDDQSTYGHIAAEAEEEISKYLYEERMREREKY